MSFIFFGPPFSGPAFLVHPSVYQVLLQLTQEAYQVLEFFKMFLTHDPTQPTKKLKNLDPT